MCRLTCDRKLSCNVHRCQNRCCPVKGNDSNAIFQQTHKCLQLCNKKQPCGHRCEQLCHIGNCPRCTNTQLTEWSCTCGDAKVLPPIICGQTQIPRCLNTCVLNRRSCCHGGGGIDGIRSWNDHLCHGIDEDQIDQGIIYDVHHANIEQLHFVLEVTCNLIMYRVLQLVLESHVDKFV
ncbi:MAG: hypothetical protein EZS28_034623 [Streblomastix strix]|uniref:NF-X1-type domain-containing protein n=1 Tax=Streblomastix strix TaxID=222440 RepID=A0A5J4UII6_9EUKA|nr:MAG: hypothetical protein EZS28_034623 [Streblomastix strix]